MKTLIKIGIMTLTATSFLLFSNTGNANAQERESASGYFYTTENLYLYEEADVSSKVIGKIAPQQVQLREKTDDGYYLINSSKGPVWIKPNIEKTKETIHVNNGAKLYKTPSSYMYLGAKLSSQYQNVQREYGDWVEINSWLGKVWLNKSEIELVSNVNMEEKINLTTAYTPLYYFPSESHLSPLHLSPQVVNGFQRNGENNEWARVNTWIGPMWLKTNFNEDINEVCNTGDTYCNWEQLRHNQPVGKDLIIKKRDINSDIIITAIHGGGIEVGTTEIADAVAGNTYKFYTLEGIRSTKNNELLHLTSTRFDEPTALKMVRNSERNISIHGFSGTEPLTHLGGLDSEMKELVRKHLVLNGFAVVDAGPEIAGINPNNITNKTSIHKGVQLELSTGQRKAFFVNEDWSRSSRTNPNNWTQEFHLYKEALQNALKELKEQK